MELCLITVFGEEGRGAGFPTLRLVIKKVRLGASAPSDDHSSRSASVSERGAAGAPSPAGRPQHLYLVFANTCKYHHLLTALSNIATKIMIKFAFAFLFVSGGVALPPNFEDVDLAADQPDGEVGIVASS